MPFLNPLRGRLKRWHHRRSLLRALPKGARCAEIGVWRGEFSRRILVETRPRELHLIDPWLFQGRFPDRWYGGQVAKSQADMDRIFEEVKRDLGQEAIVHRDSSAAALEAMPDAYFDWVYIDGDHSYPAVLADLELGRRKVRQGGYVAGDDLNWGEDFPVRRAVQEFLEKHKLGMRTFGSQFLIQI